MRKKFFFTLLIIFAVQIMQAQTTDYKVVFDLTSKDSLDQKAVMRWLNEVTTLSPEAKLEVVMYGQGVHMVVKGKSPVEDAITKLSSNKNISFKVCAIALKNQNIDKSELMPGIEIVPDGIYEIISKQKQGWGYIKAMH
jgi:intracellular sulfur oxidation DsrE/DsrF family protein